MNCGNQETASNETQESFLENTWRAVARPRNGLRGRLLCYRFSECFLRDSYEDQATYKALLDCASGECWRARPRKARSDLHFERPRDRESLKFLPIFQRPLMQQYPCLL